MIRLNEIPAVTIVLAAIAFLSALALLAVLLPSLIVFGDAAPAGNAAPAVVELPASGAEPFEAYAAIIDRPLFNPGRQKDPELAAQSAKPQLPPLTDYRLVGVVLMKDVKIGLVERRAAKQVVTLHPGDDLDGRRVDDIQADGIRFSGGETAELLAIPKVAGVARDRSSPRENAKRGR